MPWLEDRKWALIRLEGRNFGDVPLTVELKLEVHDSPNSAGVIIDAVRCAKIGLDRGIGGPLEGPCAYFMKSPPMQYHDEEAREMVEAYATAGRRPEVVRLPRDGSTDSRPSGRLSRAYPSVAVTAAWSLTSRRWVAASSTRAPRPGRGRSSP